MVEALYHPDTKLLVAHKIDHPKPRFDMDTVKRLGDSLDIPVKETSALSSQYIAESIYHVAR